MDTKYCDFDIGTPCASADIMQRHIAEHIDARQRTKRRYTRGTEKERHFEAESDLSLRQARCVRDAKSPGAPLARSLDHCEIDLAEKSTRLGVQEKLSKL